MDRRRVSLALLTLGYEFVAVRNHGWPIEAELLYF